MLVAQSVGGIVFNTLNSTRPYAGDGIGARIVAINGDIMQYIDKIDELGGNSPVDFVILKDGRVLGIDAESVVLYASMDDFHGYATVDRPSIDLV